MAVSNWQRLLSRALIQQGESWADVEAHTLSSEQLSQPIETTAGETQGPAFTLWTRRRVYFPAIHGGEECAASVARNPDGVPTGHIGGLGW